MSLAHAGNASRPTSQGADIRVIIRADQSTGFGFRPPACYHRVLYVYAKGESERNFIELQGGAKMSSKEGPTLMKSDHSKETPEYADLYNTSKEMFGRASVGNPMWMPGATRASRRSEGLDEADDILDILKQNKVREQNIVDTLHSYLHL